MKKTVKNQIKKTKTPTILLTKPAITAKPITD
jgi:hypothetical protein